MNRKRTTLAGMLAALIIMAGLAAGFAPRAGAQDAAHPSHIHAGNCDAPGEVVFPLENVVAPDEDDVVGAESALTVDAGESTIDSALADIIDGEHAIVVHESEENIANYIACGEVGGALIDGMLVVGLAPLNDSGVSGIALLEEDGDKTIVSIFLTGGDEVVESDDGADEEDAGEAASGPATVEISNFAFGPETLEIAAGTTVIWTNNDSAPHTVSQTGGGFESGKLDEGQTFRFTFDEPGTYEYFCQFHPNMTGTIVVS